MTRYEKTAWLIGGAILLVYAVLYFLLFLFYLPTPGAH